MAAIGDRRRAAGTVRLVVRDRDYARVLSEGAHSQRESSVEVELQFTEYTLTAEPSGASATIRRARRRAHQR